MNKDLDDRLIPNGEYRDALNISVGKSEQDDIGSLENVLGNNFITDWGFAAALGIKVVGYLAHEASQTFYVFLTDYTGTATYNPSTGSGSNCHIVSWSLAAGPITLVSGAFLNLTTAYPISGVNLVENLLFFTDNRNQPRKINVTNPLGYYTTETSISVAKYNPFEPIKLIKTAESVVVSGATNSILLTTVTGIEIGMTLISIASDGVEKIKGSDYITVTAINVATKTITVSSNVTVATGDLIYFLISTMTNKSGVAGWPGDPDYLESRYIRLSYRFQFDDGEYSVMAPFTQIAYIPKQKGFYLNGDEDAAYRSTILEWMENEVNNVQLLILLPDKGINCQVSNAATYKIKQLDILYKESDGLSVKVLESITSSNWAQAAAYQNTNIFTRDYQSQKPYKTLPQNQTTRVYDKVPTQALAQSVAGNRVMYGNYKDQYTPPSSINYRVAVAEKQDGVGFENWIEYPNHTLKQNRNYQVGFILADKFGRQSSVILAAEVLGTSVSGTGAVTKSSTVYSPYNETINESVVKSWFGDALQVVVDTPGIESGNNSNPLENPIKPGVISEPGLYAIPLNNSGLGFDIKGNTGLLNQGTGPYTSSFSAVINSTTTNDQYPTVASTTLELGTANASVIAGMKITGSGVAAETYIVTVVDAGELFTLNKVATLGASDVYTYTEYGSTNVPDEGDYMRGEYVDYTVVTTARTGTGTSEDPFIITTGDKINEDFYTPTLPVPSSIDVRFAYTINPIGWYSYKLVVKQQEQDYYNVYLPGILNGYPNQPTVSTIVTQDNLGVASTTVLDYPTSSTQAPLVTTGMVITGTGITDKLTVAAVNGLVSAPAAYRLIMSSARLFTSNKTLTFTSPKDYSLFPINEDNLTANIVLINDNINKVPRDLAEVGPDQKQFRSSVQLFGRVENTATGNVQYFPGISTDTAISISTAADSNMTIDTLSDVGEGNLYQFDSNPLIARLSTEKAIGTTSATMVPHLAIYETEPTESLLDLFWETTSVGLISDLNAETGAGGTGPFKISNNIKTYIESQIIDNFVTTEFRVETSAGTPVNNCVGTLSVIPASGNSKFELIRVSDVINQGSKFKIKIKELSTFVYNSPVDNNYTFRMTFTKQDTNESSPLISFTKVLTNVLPVITNATGTPSKLADISTSQATVGNLVTIPAVNGSSDTAENTLGLFWSINDSTHFEILNNNQLHKKSSTTPLGVYNLIITVTDAYDSTATPTSTGGSISATLKITVGPEGVNAGVKSPCNDGSFVFGTAYSASWPGTQQANVVPANTHGCWYVANTALLQTDLPTLYDQGTPPPARRLGSEGLTAGTVVFTLNHSQFFSQAQSGFDSFLNSTVGSWTIYRRPNGSTLQSDWQLATDINDYTIDLLQSTLVTNQSLNIGTTKYAQMVFAFNTPGEYAIIAKNISTNASSAVDNIFQKLPQVWVNSNDLNFNNCVFVPDGSNPTVNYASTKALKSYKYST